MEETLIVEKVIGIYFIFLNSLDSIVNNIQVLWPLSYFLIKLHSPFPSIYITSLLIGLMLSLYSLGKLISHKLVYYFIQKSFKCTMMILLSVSILGTVLIGIFPSFIGIFLGRFLSGLSSNSQLCTRKLLYQISQQEKSDWPGLSLKLLWSSRIGSVIGLFLSGLLSNPSFFLPEDSKFSQSRFFLLFLITSLLNISGLLLAFSIDISTLQGIENTKYTELQDKQEAVDKTVLDVKPEDKVRENFDFNKYIDEIQVIKEESVEESFNVEDVRYYSPRHVANKPSCIKAPLSARPEKAEQYSPAQTLEEPAQLEGIKKTHISYLEGDNQVEQKIIEIVEVKVQRVGKLVGVREILVFRVVLTGLLTLFWESVPFVFVFGYGIESTFRVCFILGGCFAVGTIFKMCLFGQLCKKFSFFKLFFVFLGIFVIVLFAIPAFIILQVDLIAFAGLMSLGFVCFEVVSPIGCIMISDLVSAQERESILATNDTFCIIIKVFINLLPVISIIILGPLAYYSVLAIISAGIFFYTFRVRDSFDFLLQAPYKI